MKSARIIFAKEICSYFNTPVAYIFLIVFLALSGWFFTSTLFLVGQSSIRGFLGIVPLLFLFFIPAITMRTIAEEERSGTMEILMTLPMKEWEIVWGKFLSSMALVAAALLATLIYPISVHFLGNLDWGQVISSYLALFLLGASFCSIGMFASSVTRSQIVAFILGFLICFVFFILGKVLPFVPTPFVSLVEYLSVDYHFEAISRGVLDSRNLIYYLSLSGFFLLLTFYGFRRYKSRVISVSTVLTVVGIILVGNYLSYNLFARLDLTEGQIYSISEGSVDLMSELEDPVIVKGYITKDLPFPYNAHSKYVTDLLEEYKARSKGRFRFSLINPTDDESRMEARRMGILPLTFSEIRADKYEIREGYMGLLLIYGDKREVIPAIEEISGLEYEISRKIRRITREEMEKVVFSTGHGEPDFTTQGEFTRRLGEDYDLVQVSLNDEDIPAEAKSLVVVGPRQEFSEPALRRIDEFIGRGGTAAFLIDKVVVDIQTFMTDKIATGLDTLLNHYGIELDDGLVFDNQNQTVAMQTRRGMFTMRNFVPYPLFPLVTDFNRENSMVKDLESVVFPYVSAITGGVPVAQSSDQSWIPPSLFNVSPMQDYQPGGQARRGPFPLAVTKTGRLPQLYGEGEAMETRVVVVGTSKFADPNFGGYASNYAFFFNIVDWLTQEERLINIRSKGVGLRPLKPLSPHGKRTVRWLNIVLPVVVVLGVGVVRWRVRRGRVYEV